MKHRIISYLTLCLFPLMQPALAQNQPKSFTLKEAVDFGRKNNTTVRNADLDILSAEKKVKEVLALGLPQINASGSFMNNTQIPTQVLPNFLKPIFIAVNMPGASSLSDNIAAQFGQKFTTSGSITANQLLFDGGFLMGVKASKEFVNLSRINKNRSEIETEVNVTKSYYMALITENSLHSMDSNLNLLNKLSSDMFKIYQNGLSEKTDYDRISLQVSSLKVQRDRVEDSYKLALVLLKFQMGLSVFDSIVLTDNLNDLYTSSKFMPANQIDFNQRADYRMLKQSYTLSTMNLKRYQYGYTPSLYAFLTHQENTFGASFSELGNKWYPGTFWGLSLSVPVFDGFRKSAQIQQVRIDLKKNENDLRNLEMAINMNVYQLRQSYERNAEQIKIQEANLKLAMDLYDRISLKFKNGLSSSMELSQAQNDVTNARQNYMMTLFEYFNAQTDLRKALGDIK